MVEEIRTWARPLVCFVCPGYSDTVRFASTRVEVDTVPICL